MKYLWEAADFSGGEHTAHGMMVTRGTTGSEVWLIGYTGGTGQNVALISLRDGLVNPIGNPEEAATFLNSGYLPVFGRATAEPRINFHL